MSERTYKKFYYRSYREAIKRARTLAKTVEKRVRIGAGEDPRAPGITEYVVTDSPALPHEDSTHTSFHVVATVDVAGHVEMSGSHYHRMVTRRHG